jgi:hypothetical protein
MLPEQAMDIGGGKSAKGDATVDYYHYRRMFACAMPMSAYQVPDTFTVLFYPACSPILLDNGVRNLVSHHGRHYDPG